jgi:hypothetical protein
MRYFDLPEWRFDEIIETLKRDIKKSEQTIPDMVKKHFINIVFKTGENCYQFSHYIYNLCDLKELETRKEAEDLLNSLEWLERTGDNMWVDKNHGDETYTTSDGEVIPMHYEIRESDCMVYADGNWYVRYSQEEKDKLKETLYMLEKARIYLDVYDHCHDQSSFGEGRFSDELKKRLEEFEDNYEINLDEIDDSDDY